MHGYLQKNRVLAIHRAELIIDDARLDWDDNVPKEWAKEFLARVAISRGKRK